MQLGYTGYSLDKQEKARTHRIQPGHKMKLGHTGYNLDTQDEARTHRIQTGHTG